jgi:hypothetical protein
MPYAKNSLAVNGAKLKSVESRYFEDGGLLVTARCYEYQGKNKKTDKPEGLFWTLELSGKTAEFFLDSSPICEPPEAADYVSFIGSVIDKSFEGRDGETQYRQAVRVNQISLLKPKKQDETPF